MYLYVIQNTEIYMFQIVENLVSQSYKHFYDYKLLL